jgi:hypothetical protein
VWPAHKPDTICTLPRRASRKWLTHRNATTSIASIPLFAGSVALLIGNSIGLQLGVTGFFCRGITGARILLMEILR